MTPNSTTPAIHPDFVAANLDRCRRWHPEGIDSWSLADWNQAVTGEWGEACNAAKKLRRIADQIENRADHGELIPDAVTAQERYLEECADTFIYLVIAAYVGSGNNPHALSDAIRDKFNRTSATYDFPERW